MKTTIAKFKIKGKIISFRGRREVTELKEAKKKDG